MDTKSSRNNRPTEPREIGDFEEEKQMSNSTSLFTTTKNDRFDSPLTDIVQLSVPN